jgi:hypothetical protein
VDRDSVVANAEHAARRGVSYHRAVRLARFAAVAALVLPPMLAVAPPPAAASDDPLIGLWMYRAPSLPGLHGALSVTRQGTSWRATLSGSDARFEAAWVTRSTSPRVEISPATTGLSGDAFQNAYLTGPDGPSQDGYAWHIVGIRSGDRTVREYNASGNGGQLIFVIPDYELVVVLTGGNYDQGGIWNRWRHDIVGAGVLPAIQPDKPPRP